MSSSTTTNPIPMSSSTKEDFTYANLKNIWSQRDCQPLKIKPPTARTPLRLANRSPIRPRIEIANASNTSGSVSGSVSVSSEADKRAKANRNRNIMTKMSPNKRGQNVARAISSLTSTATRTYDSKSTSSMGDMRRSSSFTSARAKALAREAEARADLEMELKLQQSVGVYRDTNLNANVGTNLDMKKKNDPNNGIGTHDMVFRGSYGSPALHTNNTHSTSSTNNPSSISASPGKYPPVVMAQSPLQSSPNTTLEQESSYDKEITSNLMRTNANDYTTDPDSSGEARLPRPTRLWHDSDPEISLSPSLESELELEDSDDTDNDSSISQSKPQSRPRPRSQSQPHPRPQWQSESFEETFGISSKSRSQTSKQFQWRKSESFDQNTGGKAGNGAGWKKNGHGSGDALSRDRSRSRGRDRDGDGDGVFDPYDKFESMTSVNSESTVRVENKQTTKLINALNRKKERKISRTFDKQYEMDGNIPDSAFGISATNLARNVMKKDHQPKRQFNFGQPPNQTKTSTNNQRHLNNREEKTSMDTTTTANSTNLFDQSGIPFDQAAKCDNAGENSYGSLFENVPRCTEQQAKSVTESDVFDGLSDIGSVVPPASFGKNYFAEAPDVDFATNADIPGKNGKNDRIDVSGIRGGGDDKQMISNDFFEDWLSGNNDAWASNERSKEGKKKLSANLAAFAKNSTSTKSKNLDGNRMKLKIPKKAFNNPPQNGKSSKSHFQTMESVGEENHSTTSNGSSNHSEISITESAVSFGIAPLEHNIRKESIHNHSEQLDFFSGPSIQQSSNKSPLDSKTAESNAVLDTDPEPSLPDDEEDSLTDESAEPYTVQYPSAQDEETDAVANVRWIPSMLRLYQKKVVPTNTDGAQNMIRKFNHSPSSVVDLSTRDQPEVSDCKFKGVQTISLYHSQPFGGEIENPSDIVTKGPMEIDDDIKRKLRHHVEGMNRREKRLGMQGKKRGIFDTAIEVHEKALALVENGKFDDAIVAYETFFKSYARREMTIENKVTEKKIISAFLLNMGILYFKMEDFDFSSDFLNEAIETLEPEDETRDNDIANALNQIGMAKFAAGEYEEALKKFADCLAIWQDLDNTSGMTQALNNIGGTYYALDESNAAMEAFEEALELQRSVLLNYFGSQRECINQEDHDDIQSAFVSLSKILCNMAYIYKATASSNSCMTARHFVEESLSIQVALSCDAPPEDIFVDILSDLNLSDTCEL